MYFKVVVALEDKGLYEKFADAFKQFFYEVTDLVKEGTLFEILETACYIECQEKIGDKDVRVSVMFDELKLLGYGLGYLVEGKIVDPLPEHSNYSIFLQARLLNMNRQLLDLLSIFQATARA